MKWIIANEYVFIIIIIAHEKTKTIDEEDMLRKTENDRVEYSTPIYSSFPQY